jgi:hypothetical protein
MRTRLCRRWRTYGVPRDLGDDGYVAGLVEHRGAEASGDAAAELPDEADVSLSAYRRRDEMPKHGFHPKPWPRLTVNRSAHELILRRNVRGSGLQGGWLSRHGRPRERRPAEAASTSCEQGVVPIPPGFVGEPLVILIRHEGDAPDF